MARALHNALVSESLLAFSEEALAAAIAGRVTMPLKHIRALHLKSRINLVRLFIRLEQGKTWYKERPGELRNKPNPPVVFEGVGIDTTNLIWPTESLNPSAWPVSRVTIRQNKMDDTVRVSAHRNSGAPSTVDRTGPQGRFILFFLTSLLSSAFPFLPGFPAFFWRQPNGRRTFFEGHYCLLV